MVPTSFALQDVMESLENCTIISKRRDGTRAELDKAEIRHKVGIFLRKRSRVQYEYNRENRDAKSAYDKQYYQENRDTISVQTKQYHQKNRDTRFG